ncbi:MAG: hypothetical protein C4330_11440 [Chitinophagaceae bacterium]
MSTPRWGIAAVACGNNIFFAGGEDGQTTTYNNVDVYDAAANTWLVLHIPAARAFMSAETMGNKVFLQGVWLSITRYSIQRRVYLRLGNGHMVQRNNLKKLEDKSKLGLTFINPNLKNFL